MKKERVKFTRPVMLQVEILHHGASDEMLQ
jgi:hypothetical protein